jgi:hypothetical protein
MNSSLEGVHLLTTYRCDRECDHCFVWASPMSKATMTIAHIRDLLAPAKEIDKVGMVYFEGGEPLLFYPSIIEGVRIARSMGLDVGIVTNGYWGTSAEDARLWLTPLAELGISDLTISDDEFHRFSSDDIRAREVVKVAKDLGIPVGVIEVCKPVAGAEADGGLYFRGRASDKLAAESSSREPSELRSCPEDLRAPGRVHVDPYGLVHICQGLVIGDTSSRRLKEVMEAYDPSSHPVISALIEGGPAELVRRFELELPVDRFADDCHLCYVARTLLRERFPELLGPDEMYGGG